MVIDMTKWISTKHKSPKDKQLVLVVIDHLKGEHEDPASSMSCAMYIKSDNKYFVETYDPYDADSEFGVITLYYDDLYGENPTHWAELPLTPSEKNTTSIK